jgi:lipid II:glycine glycyltransferase (peptidoglycan interpeptide bridge formation enzyme)
MYVEMMTKTDVEEYRKFIQTMDNSSIYHTLDWKEIIQDSYGFQPLYIIAKEKDAIIGSLPLFKVGSFLRGQRLVCIPFSHYVEILAKDNSAVGEMLTFLKTYFENNSAYKYISIHNSQGYIRSPAFRRKVSYYSCRLELKNRDLNNIWDSFDGNVRKGIRKAEKSGIEVIKGDSLDSYKGFYRLIELTRREQGAPVYPFRFIYNLYDKLLPKNMCRLYLALYRREVIAGILMLLYKRYAIYGYGGSVRGTEILKTRPNNLLFWDAIQDCLRERYEVFDFGSTPFSHKGLLQFKKQWGTKLEELSYSFMFRGSEGSIIDRNSKAVVLIGNIMRVCPLSLLRIVSPYMMKEIP